MLCGAALYRAIEPTTIDRADVVESSPDDHATRFAARVERLRIKKMPTWGTVTIENPVPGALVVAGTNCTLVGSSLEGACPSRRSLMVWHPNWRPVSYASDSLSCGSSSPQLLQAGN
jgi:hypothetical protein